MTMVVVMIAFAAMFYFNIHKALHVKAVSRNAGDAAALAGARWQAISLNLIGSLNVAQALALSESISAGSAYNPEAELISDLQKRISISGPLYGFVAAQQAAKQNGIFNNDHFATLIRDHADIIRSTPFPITFEPSGFYTSPRDEVADMFELIASHGVAIMEQIPRTSPYYLLLDRGFYAAIATENWCWFYNNRIAYETLLTYDEWFDWSEWITVSDLRGLQSDFVRTNIFDLHLQWMKVQDSIRLPEHSDSWGALFSMLQDIAQSPLYEDIDARFAFLDGNRWGTGSWSTRPSMENFPWTSPIRSEYDHFGTFAVVSVNTQTDGHIPYTNISDIQWLSAAKPFGQINNSPIQNGHILALPSFTDVRLVPFGSTDARSEIPSSHPNQEWIQFLTTLEEYLLLGPDALPENNFYADQLRRWENRGFRQDGINWLVSNSGSCIRRGSGSGGTSGGTSHGH
ncbi:MAG: hypothetical protein WD490_08650 [Opitutales bacterium]